VFVVFCMGRGDGTFASVVTLESFTYASINLSFGADLIVKIRAKCLCIPLRQAGIRCGGNINNPFVHQRLSDLEKQDANSLNDYV
jgi:hypothetical protein